eukprot:TRINITY_DN48640_c0_g1_i1.p1 TRINITY_DN48640_c0_g1~~TRINITY_DN48640_c0_g1_i1.p1  ORF type:complete len:262 (+),score=54.20 TRINITY_DN48640_c0_g1_i1:72-857(+)
MTCFVWPVFVLLLSQGISVVGITHGGPGPGIFADTLAALQSAAVPSASSLGAEQLAGSPSASGDGLGGLGGLGGLSDTLGSSNSSSSKKKKKTKKAAATTAKNTTSAAAAVPANTTRREKKPEAYDISVNNPDTTADAKTPAVANANTSGPALSRDIDQGGNVTGNKSAVTPLLNKELAAQEKAEAEAEPEYGATASYVSPNQHQSRRSNVLLWTMGASYAALTVMVVVVFIVCADKHSAPYQMKEKAYFPSEMSRGYTNL